MTRMMRSTLLWIGALVGLACIVWTIGLAVTGTQPLAVLSNSMEPAISAGDVVFVRPAPAAELDVGDVVSVIADDGVRVTHRIADMSVGANGRETLQLQGDANASPDAEVYDAREAARVVGTVAHVGTVLIVLSSPVGMLAGGLLMAASLALGLRPRRGGDAVRASRPSVWPIHWLAPTIVIVLVLGSSTPSVEPTRAYFSDTPTAQTPSDGVEAAPWFRCSQSTSSAAYGSQPWAHLSLDEDSGSTQLVDPYFRNSTGATAWDAYMYNGVVRNGALVDAGRGRSCRRDVDSQSVHFDGLATIATVEYLRMRSSATNANGGGTTRWTTFSINIWYKTNIAAGDDLGGVLAAYSQAATTEVAPTDRVLYLDRTGRLNFNVGPAGAVTTRRSSGVYADNAWHMATATFGPGGMCLYLDARIAGGGCAAAGPTIQSTANSYWRFGFANLGDGTPNLDNGSVAQRAFEGFIDDAAIWTRQLSADEILAMYRSGLPLLG